MKALPVLAAGGLVFAAVWLIAAELPFAARALAALLIGPLPAFTILQADTIAQFKAEELPSRLRMYGSTILGLWGLALAAAIAATESGFRPELIGVALLPWPSFLLWLAFSLAAVAALVIAFRAFGIRESATLHYLIPQTAGEKVVFVGVSLTAGICEELVFRGFLIGALTAATSSAVVAALIAAVAFGVSHAHQSGSGALRAGMLGLVLSVPLLMTGSLYPGIAAHAIVDVLGGLWLSKWLLRS